MNTALQLPHGNRPLFTVLWTLHSSCPMEIGRCAYLVSQKKMEKVHKKSRHTFPHWQVQKWRFFFLKNSNWPFSVISSLLMIITPLNWPLSVMSSPYDNHSLELTPGNWPLSVMSSLTMIITPLNWPLSLMSSLPVIITPLKTTFCDVLSPSDNHSLEDHFLWCPLSQW